MNGPYKIAVFEDEEKLISSIKKLNEKGLEIHDVFMPYPIHEVLHLLKRKSRLPTVALIYGLSAVVLVLSFLYWTSVIDWPVVYGGKPFNSFPSFIVVTIVLTIFTVTILGLFTFSVRSRLYPGRDNKLFHECATDDKFVIVLDAGKIGEEAVTSAGVMMKAEGAVEVLDKNYEELKFTNE
jgi:hypothetical protein